MNPPTFYLDILLVRKALASKECNRKNAKQGLVMSSSQRKRGSTSESTYEFIEYQRGGPMNIHESSCDR